MDPIVVSIVAAAKLLSCSRSKVYQLIEDGRLDTCRLGRRHLVRLESLHQLLSDSAVRRPLSVKTLSLDQR
jgi:excisionase family DNA binding protein